MSTIELGVVIAGRYRRIRGGMRNEPRWKMKAAI
jgi:hypothetical protein